MSRFTFSLGLLCDVLLYSWLLLGCITLNFGALSQLTPGRLRVWFVDCRSRSFSLAHFAHLANVRVQKLIVHDRNFPAMAGAGDEEQVKGDEQYTHLEEHL